MHPLNILLISVNDSTLKLFKFKEVKELQSLNILEKEYTLLVLNLDKSIFSKEEHPSNNDVISVTEFVSKFSLKLILFTELQF
jgi:hypothetical protein